MCPLCKEHDGKTCGIEELPNGRLRCSCHRHSWPNTAALEETCRRMSLTLVRTVHTWTQSL